MNEMRSSDRVEQMLGASICKRAILLVFMLQMLWNVPTIRSGGGTGGGGGAAAAGGGVAAADDQRRGRRSRVANLGVNYGMVGDDLASPEAVVEMLRLGTRIGSVRLYAPDARVLRALQQQQQQQQQEEVSDDDDIIIMSVVVGVPDAHIPSLAASVAAASHWLATFILPFYPSTNIVALTVGNEILTTSPPLGLGLHDLLLPAIVNLRAALVFAGAPHLYVSTTHSMALLATSFPPSAARFKPRLLPLLRPLLAFLASTGAPFMINSYPYFAYKHDPQAVSLDYALFRPNRGVTDANTALTYTNLFDAQVDAIYFAMKAAGFDNIPVVVAESGWPSMGDEDEIGATVANAREYNRNLIRHITSNVGTPAKPNTVLYAYIFSLFNENQKPGPISERNFGLLYPSMRPVYDLGGSIFFQSEGGLGNWRDESTRGGGGGGEYPRGGDTNWWCVAKPTTTTSRGRGPQEEEEEEEKALRDILQYACGDGDADCRAIQQGGTCFFPNSLHAHASYAMNSYFQLHGRHSWNCDFKGHAMLTTINPSYGSCIYPSR